MRPIEMTSSYAGGVAQSKRGAIILKYPFVDGIMTNCDNMQLRGRWRRYAQWRRPSIRIPVH